MFKKSENPIVEELTKSNKARSLNLDLIKPILINGIKICAWCCKEKVKGPKYCSSTCSTSARAHFYPQKEEALNCLLIRQDWKCNDCGYDWKSLAKQLIKVNDYFVIDDLTRYSYWLMRRVKSKSPKDRKPEVDHIVPISKGGQSLGLDNTHCLCYTCHKNKTKKDNSGPRKTG